MALPRGIPRASAFSCSLMASFGARVRSYLVHKYRSVFRRKADQLLNVV
jgi:hypothetical protein